MAAAKKTQANKRASSKKRESDESVETYHSYKLKTSEFATEMQGKGMYTGQDRSILICALTITAVHNLKTAVAKEDPQAFVIVSPSQEILGRGFNPLEENKYTPKNLVY